MLLARDLVLTVPGRVLARGLSITVRPGEVWAVLGRNGTGKSTLIHVLGGLAAPSSGGIELDGRPLASVRARERARALGVLLQIEEGAFWGCAVEYVLLGRFPHAAAWSGWSREDLARAHAALDAVGMGALAARRFTTLSGGERQRVRIAQVLAQSPRLFLLDEPLQHLDLAHQGEVLALLAAHARERQQAAVVVMHEPLWMGRSCTHAILFDGRGGIESGCAAQILTRERLERAYGVRLREIGTREERCFVPDV
jgi:iron complex transport system ATP-binding protein